MLEQLVRETRGTDGAGCSATKFVVRSPWYVLFGT